MDRPGPDALQGNRVCDANPSCVDTRMQFEKLIEARNDGRVDEINQLAGQLQGVDDRQSLTTTVNQLNSAFARLTKAISAMGLDTPGGARAGLNDLQDGADRLADGSRQVAGGVDELVEQIKVMAAGLDQAAAFLLTMRHDASSSNMAGFSIPAEVLNAAEFQKAAEAYISPDGHSVRYLVQTKLNPFSSEAMDQVNTISDIARGAQPNTTLADASISMGGFPAALRDTRDYYERDIRFIIMATLIVVLLTLTVLLRSIVAPIYLVGTVVLSYFAAIGIGVVTFQGILGQQLHWSVPPLAFVVLVAVGADYNMLFVSRMRDESPHSIRFGIIRTLGSTGGVITAAGLIFAASMAGLLFSSIGIVIQGGFVIGVGGSCWTPSWCAPSRCPPSPHWSGRRTGGRREWVRDGRCRVRRRSACSNDGSSRAPMMYVKLRNGADRVGSYSGAVRTAGTPRRRIRRMITDVH